MSTKLTKKSPEAGYDLVDSHSLTLIQAAAAFQTNVSVWLLEQLKQVGFDSLTASQLSFLGTLDCGQNYASEIARSVGISRQAVHKTVRELEALGWLATRPDAKRGNQRVIVFTQEGERMMSVARQKFLKLDQALIQQFGEDALIETNSILAFDPKQLTKL